MLDKLEIPLCVVLLHAEGRLLEMISFESIVCLTLHALQVHVNSLLGVLRMLVAVGCLLIEILGVILAILLGAEHVAKEAAFQCLVSFRAKLVRLCDKIRASQCFNHYYSNLKLYIFMN